MAAAPDSQPDDSAASASEPRFLIVGRITRPHGVRGEVRVHLHTDEPARFIDLETIWLGEDEPAPRPVERVRFHQGAAILKLGGVETRNDAEALRNEWLQVPIGEAIPLEEGEYFYYQLIGLQVETTAGEVLGELAEILETGANDVLIVRGPSGELLLPDIPEVVLDIDVAAGRILVELPAGLRDE